MNPSRSLPLLVLAACALLASGCTQPVRSGGDAAPATTASTAQPAAAEAGTPLAGARQLLLVTVDGWDSSTGTLHTFERRDRSGAWIPSGLSAPVSIGRSGAAWGEGLHLPQPEGPRKREGDGRSPAGAYPLGTAFGYAAEDRTAMPYAAMGASHWCMDVPASPLYNRIVNAAAVGAAAVQGSSEPMRLDLHADGDQRYRLGFVIQHNAAARAGAGSCIFAHLWGAPGQPTAGCTAMAPATMRALLDWLQPAAAPRLVLLPAGEYARLRAAWQLPRVPLQ